MARQGMPASRSRASLGARVREVLTGYLFVAPALVSLAVWWVWPMLYSCYLSLTEWDFMSPEKQWVGLSHYQSIFGQSEFQRVLWNTVYFSVGSVTLAMVLGLLLALVLRGEVRGVSVYRALMFSPWVTPTVAASLVWLWLYNRDMGLFNHLLSALGLARVDWIGSGRGVFRLWAMPSLILFTVWKTVGYTMVYYLAGLTNIPAELYEAAEIDGANKWGRFRYVTLPLLSPMTFFLLIVSVISAFNAFDQIRVITQGGPGDATRTMVYYLYQNAFQFFKVGYGSAVAIILFVLLLALTMVQFVLAGRWVHYA